MVEVFSHPLSTRYYAPRLSLSWVFMFCVWFGAILIAFISAYLSFDFWIAQTTYREQPVVNFQHKLIAEFTNGAGVMSAGGTPQQYNDIIGPDILRYPDVKDAHIDINNDGRPDIINISLTWPLTPSEVILKFDVLLFFRLRLLDRLTVSMQNPIHIGASSPVSGYEYHYLADLKYRSVNPISTQSIRSLYDVDLMDTSTIDTIDDVLFTPILRATFARNESLVVDRDSVQEFWVNGQSNGPAPTFKVFFTFRIPPQTIELRPERSWVLKQSWIQFITVFAVFYVIGQYILSFVFGHQILETRIRRDVTPIAKQHQF